MEFIPGESYEDWCARKEASRTPEQRAWAEAMQGGRPVRLTVDLTRYDNRLVVGEVGTIVNPLGSYGDRFAVVQFQNGARLQVLYASLALVQGNDGCS